MHIKYSDYLQDKNNVTQLICTKIPDSNNRQAHTSSYLAMAVWQDGFYQHCFQNGSFRKSTSTSEYISTSTLESISKGGFINIGGGEWTNM